MHHPIILQWALFKTKHYHYQSWFAAQCSSCLIRWKFIFQHIPAKKLIATHSVLFRTSFQCISLLLFQLLSGHGINNKLSDKLFDLLRQLHVEQLRCVYGFQQHKNTKGTSTHYCCNSRGSFAINNTHGFLVREACTKNLINFSHTKQILKNHSILFEATF